MLNTSEQFVFNEVQNDTELWQVVAAAYHEVLHYACKSDYYQSKADRIAIWKKTSEICSRGIVIIFLLTILI